MNVASTAPSPQVADGLTRSAEPGEARAADKVTQGKADHARTAARQQPPGRAVGRLLDIKV